MEINILIDLRRPRFCKPCEWLSVCSDASIVGLSSWNKFSVCKSLARNSSLGSIS